MASRPCLTRDCPGIALPGQGRCKECAARADRDRGTATQRGYTGRGHRVFRTRVLARDPVCKVCRVALSTVADHYPMSRRELVDAGLDPNDPARGRGLCFSCHSRETARLQPGGFISRDA